MIESFDSICGNCKHVHRDRDSRARMLVTGEVIEFVGVRISVAPLCRWCAEAHPELVYGRGRRGGEGKHDRSLTLPM